MLFLFSGFYFAFFPLFFWLFSFGRPLFFYQIYLSAVCFGWWRILFFPIFIAAGRVLEWALMWRCVYHARFNIYFVDKFVNSPVGYWKKGMTEDRDIIARTPHTYIHIARSWFTHPSAVSLLAMPNLFQFFSLYLHSVFALFLHTLSLSSNVRLLFRGVHSFAQFWMVSYVRSLGWCDEIRCINTTSFNAMSK